MDENIALLQKAFDVIQSCQTPEQLQVAKRFATLAVRRWSKTELDAGDFTLVWFKVRGDKQDLHLFMWRSGQSSEWLVDNPP